MVVKCERGHIRGVLRDWVWRVFVGGCRNPDVLEESVRKLNPGPPLLTLQQLDLH